MSFSLVALGLYIRAIKDKMLKNHGYYRHVEKDGSTSSIVSCDDGVYQFFPPKVAGGEWTIEKLIGDAASDGLLLDLDGDGEEELCTIAPFRGDTINIYHKRDGKGYTAQILDKGCGAANVLHYVHNGKDIVIATNREVNEIAMYELT